MELYEALKSGTSAEDLEAAFRKELTAAQNRISKESEDEAKKTYLNNCRADLAEAIYDYVCAFSEEFGDDNSKDEMINTSHIEDKLAAIEQDICHFYNKTKELKEIFNMDKFFNKAPADSEDTADDNDIINSFLKSLR